MTKKVKQALNQAALKAAFGNSKMYDGSTPSSIGKESQGAGLSSYAIPSSGSGASRGKPLALAMMIKNEEKRIEVTFDSVKDVSNVFVIFDTGSTDRTIEICKEYCAKNNITLFLKEGPFVNFCVSRNVLLDFADEVLKSPHYLLLLDCNDELRSIQDLKTFITTYNGTATGFHCKQQWWTGHSLDTYFNIRMVLSHEKWRYKAVVHEYICQPKQKADAVIRLDQIVLYQDRTKDDDKSMRRFNRDKDLLYTEYVKDPSDPRTIFYLAQTCSCLGQHTEAYLYYSERIKQDGFIEEQYHSYYRLGEISQILGHPWEEALCWYLKAYNHSSRVEPLLKIARYYMQNSPLQQNKPDMMTAYMYASQACKLIYPHQQILFVNRQAYLYERWSLLGIISFYVGRYREGKEACIKALQAEPTSQIDMDNLQHYLRKNNELSSLVAQKAVPFPSGLVLDLENGPYYPEQEEGAGFGNRSTREEILKKSLSVFLEQSKGLKK